MGTPALSSELDLEQQVSLHLLELRQELRCRGVVGTRVACDLGPRAWHLVWLEAVALLRACRVEVATDAFEFQFVHVLETAHGDDLWDVLVIQPEHALRGRM